MKMRRAMLPVLVFVIVVLIHFLWLGLFPARPAEQTLWEDVPTEQGSSWVSRYLEAQSYSDNPCCTPSDDESPGNEKFFSWCGSVFESMNGGITQDILPGL